jgi:hypothetical protein
VVAVALLGVLGAGVSGGVASSGARPQGVASAAAAGSFVLDASATEVKNPNGPELSIDAAGQQAVDDHTGVNGGAGKGGNWRVTYTWQVPQTLVPGKSASIMLGIRAEAVDPVQPLALQMNALAPDFAQALSIHYPDQSSGSQTFPYAFAADQKDSPGVTVTVGVLSAQVVYHYRPVPVAATPPPVITTPAGGSGSCSAASVRKLFAVRAQGPPRPSGGVLPYPIHGKLGVGLTAAPTDDSDRELVKVIEKIPELGGVYSVDDPMEMFDFLLEVKKEVRPIDYLVIGGHGSGGRPGTQEPVIEFAGQSLRADDVDLPAIRAQLEAAKARPQTKLTKDLVCKLTAKIAYLESLSDAMAANATVVLLNCSTLGTPKGRKFAADLGRLLLSKRGGVLIASRTDVQYGVTTVGGTLLNTFLLGTPTFFRNLFYWARGDISWDDFKWVYDAPAGEGYVKGQFEAIKIPAETH